MDITIGTAQFYGNYQGPMSTLGWPAAPDSFIRDTSPVYPGASSVVTQTPENKTPLLVV